MTNYPKIEVTVEVCHGCNGKGHTSDYHRDYEDYNQRECVRCEGSGRINVTTTISEEPYKPSK